MTTQEFNEKYKACLDDRHYGLDISCPEVIDYLDREFEVLSKMPNFSYSQIKGKFENLSVYVGDPHEKVREVVERGGRGINGDEPLKYVVLKDISDNWLEAIITYEEEHRPKNMYLPIYREEQLYRKQNNTIHNKR